MVLVQRKAETSIQEGEGQSSHKAGQVSAALAKVLKPAFHECYLVRLGKTEMLVSVWP